MVQCVLLAGVVVVRGGGPVAVVVRVVRVEGALMLEAIFKIECAVIRRLDDELQLLGMLLLLTVGEFEPLYF